MTKVKVYHGCKFPNGSTTIFQLHLLSALIKTRPQCPNICVVCVEFKDIAKSRVLEITAGHHAICKSSDKHSLIRPYYHTVGMK